MTVRKSISFTDQHDQWMKAQLATGQYSSESEIVRDLIRKDQAHNAELETLRAALITGEKSGVGMRSSEDVRIGVQKRLKNSAGLI